VGKVDIGLVYIWEKFGLGLGLVCYRFDLN